MTIPGSPAEGARRPIARILLAACAAVTLLLAPAVGAESASAAESADAGLFGSQDPTYDGVLRQSTAILGLDAAGQRVPASAVTWLLGQQCADGSFASYRADTATPCPPVDLTAYTGPDTNSTAAAVIALEAIATGRSGPLARAAAKARAWLRSQQGSDGGYAWFAGLESDALSTSMVLAALGRGTASERRAARWLDAQVDAAGGCGVRFQPGGSIDPLSTTWSLISTMRTLPPQPIRGARTPRTCTADGSVRDAASWISGALISGRGEIASTYAPGETDWNSTALGTLGMTQRTGTLRAMRLGIAALQDNVTAYVGSAGAESPTALGTLLMVAHAGRANPRDFGGMDLLRTLRGTLTR